MGQINWSRIAERSTTPTRHAGTVGTDPAARALTATGPIGYVGVRRHGNKRPSNDRGQDLWRTVSPSYRTVATIDRRWSK